jgi:CheY-like chemotaxis protein
LVVDDDQFNRDILQELLTEAGYSVTLAADGEEAWEIIERQQHNFSTILLDRMMPRLDGMGLLSRIKSSGQFSAIPVIFQTAIDAPSDIAGGIKAGAFYYLTKPVNKEVLFAIVHSAVNTFNISADLNVAFNQVEAKLTDLMLRNEFQLRTLPEARILANALSGYYPDPQRVILGISELLINAVEHGNLGISYHEKSSLLQAGVWDAEIERRLTLPENASKKVTVVLEHKPHELRLEVTDCGAGFNYQNYLEISPERAFDPNGRGIAMSKRMSFDTLQYLGGGNRLVAVVNI